MLQVVHFSATLILHLRVAEHLIPSQAVKKQPTALGIRIAQRAIAIINPPTHATTTTYATAMRQPLNAQTAPLEQQLPVTTTTCARVGNQQVLARLTVLVGEGVVGV
jgi:hypothetical protein